MCLDVRVLEAHDDVYDYAAGVPTNQAEISGETTTDEHVVAPEVTQELNRLQTLGRPHRARLLTSWCLEDMCTVRKPSNGWMIEWWQKVANESCRRGVHKMHCS